MNQDGIVICYSHSSTCLRLLIKSIRCAQFLQRIENLRGNPKQFLTPFQELNFAKDDSIQAPEAWPSNFIKGINKHT